jgi:hypothetical protein
MQAQQPQPAAVQASQSEGAAGAGEKTGPFISVLENTLLRVRSVETITSRHAHNGTQIRFIVAEDVFVDSALAIPRGAMVNGLIVEAKKPGVLAGAPDLQIKLTSLEMGGKSYPVYSYLFRIAGENKSKTTVKDASRGSVVGAVAGGVASGVSKNGVVASNSDKAVSMLAGAAVGAGVGTLVSAGTPGDQIWLPSETQIDFYLASPVAVTPVSEAEARHMAEGLHPGGPVLYLRGEKP